VLVGPGQRLRRELQAAAAAERLGLDHRRRPHREIGLREPGLQHLGEMAAGDHDVGHALLGQPVQLVLENRAAGPGDLDHRLRPGVGVRPQPRTGAAGQHDRLGDVRHVCVF